MTIDLLLGGDLGRWVLDQVRPSDIHLVFSDDEEIRRAGAGGGFVVAPTSLGQFEGGVARRCLSVHYPRILAPEVLERFDLAVNLHPGLLPFGRGYYPVFWALWEGTPAGATLHHMSATVDAGPIVDQLQVPVRDNDSGASLHARVREAERELFTRHWAGIRDGDDLPRHIQTGDGSFHTLADFVRLRDEPDLSTMTAADLVRLCRALQMPGRPGPAIMLGDLRYRMQLARESDQEGLV